MAGRVLGPDDPARLHNHLSIEWPPGAGAGLLPQHTQDNCSKYMVMGLGLVCLIIFINLFLHDVPEEIRMDRL